MRKLAYLLIVAILVLGAPVLAQGPFNDVPTDHWAYDAVNKLQKDGIVIGYPDGTFGGKRAMSRYEFATAIARVLPLLTQDLSAYATKADLQQAIAGIKIPADMPDLSSYATKADVDALKKLIDEFRDTLAAMGVDVDALKRDVAALQARVDALETEQKRVRFTGDVNVFGISTDTEQGNPFDLDERETNGAPNPASETNVKKDTLIRNIAVVRDFDLNVVGRVSQTTTANATINYGNYLQYLGFIDDYADGVRPYNKNNFENTQEVDTADMFFPYYMYINTGLCKGSLTVGRMPLQFTPYTMKKIDVDSYTSILKTDDGNYPVDGIKAAYNFGGVDVTLFAVRNDLNSLLQNGLTGQPNAGLSANNVVDDFTNTVTGPLHNDGFIFQTNGLNGNHAVGNLPSQITQTAGGRLTVGTPWKGVFGATYYQSWAEGEWAAMDPTYDQARVFGGDLTIPIGKFGFVGSWTQSDTLASSLAAGAIKDVTDDNTAWDAAVNGSFGRLGAIAGYKQIGRNFASAGSWDKIGRWTNPVDVKGPYLDLSYPIARKLKVALNGEYLTMMNDVRGAVADGLDSDGAPVFIPNTGWGAKDDNIIKAEAGLKWGISKTNSLDLGYQWVRYAPDNEAISDATETYLTVGWAHQLNPNSGFNVGYQFINYDDGGVTAASGPGPYVGDYRGGVGVAQFSVSF